MYAALPLLTVTGWGNDEPRTNLNRSRALELSSLADADTSERPGGPLPSSGTVRSLSILIYLWFTLTIIADVMYST